MATITKKQLIDRIAETSNLKRVAVKRCVQQFLDEVIDELGKGNRLEFRDFGVFEVRERAARVAQNPKTLQRVPVPAKKIVRFKAGRRMKEALDGVTVIEASEEQAPQIEVKVKTSQSSVISSAEKAGATRDSE